MDYRAEQHKLEVRELKIWNDMWCQMAVGVVVILLGLLAISAGLLT